MTRLLVFIGVEKTFFWRGPWLKIGDVQRFQEVRKKPTTLSILTPQNGLF